jgi:hypothetical protein
MQTQFMNLLDQRRREENKTLIVRQITNSLFDDDVLTHA